MSSHDDLVSELHAGRTRFLELVATIRPELHRYCARMTGSVTDAEDIVQETLARAYYALADYDEMPSLRPYLFRIAHRRAIDHLRRYDRRMGEPLDEATAEAATLDPEDAYAREQAVRAALTRFLDLPPAPRSCVILKDVLGYSLEAIADLLELSVPAVKAALHRGRVRLAEQQHDGMEQTARPPSPQVARYAGLFNARDWDALRAMLADDVRLEVVTRARRKGRAVGQYFERYELLRDWHVTPARLGGLEVLAVSSSPGEPPRYFIELTFEAGRVRSIRDYRHVPYIAADAPLVLSHE